jgi:hypothetical protein
VAVVIVIEATEYESYSGRWISRDPAGLEVGENAYEFCDGNPLTKADPKGLDGQPMALIILGDRSSGGDPLERMVVEGENAAAGMALMFQLEGYKVTILRNPEQVAAERALAKTDAFYFWGHGAGASLCLNSEGEFISPQNLPVVQQMREQAKKGPLQFVMLNACHSISDGGAAWSGIAPIVFGHVGNMDPLARAYGRDNPIAVIPPTEDAASVPSRPKKKKRRQGVGN